MGSLAQFFDPQQPPPPAVDTPHDAGLLQRITKLVEFATRNGPSFVELIKSKQKDNVEYGFLFDGEGSAFYRHALYSGLSAGAAPQPAASQPPAAPQVSHHQQQQQPVPPQQPDGAVQQQQQQHTQPQYPGYDQSHQQACAQPYGVPPEVASGFAQVLSSLTGSRDSIRSSAAWFLGAQQHAWGLAQQMAVHAAALPDHQQRLHVVYLANDALLKALEARVAGSAPEADAVAALLRPVLPGILATTATAGGSTQEAKDRLMQIVHFWRDKGVYDGAAVAELETAVSTGQVPQQSAYGQPQYQPPLSAPGAYPQAAAQPYGHQPAPQQQWGAAPQSHPDAPQGGAYPPQPGVSPPQPSAWYPPPGVPPAAMAPPPDVAFAQQAAGGYAPVPQVAPIAPPTPPLPNPIGFPPGLLPQLVRAREGDGSYTPIPEGDVAAAKMPPLREPDAYLKSRLDQFYAELQDYRPGLSRADVEAQQRAQRRAEGRMDDAAHPPERSHAQHAKTFDGPPPRGSAGGGGGGGGRGGGYIGLGFEEERRPQMSERQGDKFEAFRQQRSSGYYDMIGRNSVEAAVKRGESFGGRG